MKPAGRMLEWFAMLNELERSVERVAITLRVN